MFACSSDFHQAVANGNEQKALLIFDDLVFTDTDISVENGIQFREYFNTEEDLAIGQANSNELSVSLFNDDGLLNSYAFGEFVATLGVFLEQETYQQVGNSVMNTNLNTWRGSGTYPYVLRNGNAVDVQPDFPVCSLLGYGGNVWCFGDDGQFAVYRDADGQEMTSWFSLNTFMQHKTAGWAGKGIFYNRDTRILNIWDGGIKKKYEFVPLGVFVAKRPSTPDTIRIDLTCYDRMQKFDVDMPSPEELGMTYPATVKTLFEKMCDYLEVPYVNGNFINSGIQMAAEPEDFKSVTMRDVLKWIAEAAASNARFNRSGLLELTWLRSTGQNYTANEYTEFNPTWYATKQVTKLQNRSTHGNADTAYGSGRETYLIQDNPLLEGVS